VHYAGVSCDMSSIMQIASKHNLLVVEDAAQTIDSYHIDADGNKRALGSIGHLAAFSFHETKNIMSGEGGLLAINDERFIKRAEIIREKGTNRSAFFRGEVDKYNWVDIGSSFLPSDIIAAFLYAQLENIEKIQKQRKLIWDLYHKLLTPLQIKGIINLPKVPQYATNNGHMFYIDCKTLANRTKIIEALKSNGILAVFHYLSLHKSGFYQNKHDGRELINSDYYTDTLLRLPLYFELSEQEVELIAKIIIGTFE
jgi:dTDP-4-amino-4,6-dideoxygalactose transaminase